MRFFILVTLLLSIECPAVSNDLQHSQMLPSDTCAAFSFVDIRRWREEIADSKLNELFSSEKTKSIRDALLGFEGQSEIQVLLDEKLIDRFASGQGTVALLPVGNKIKVVAIIQCKDATAASHCQAEIESVFDGVNFKKIGKHLIFSKSSEAVSQIPAKATSSLSMTERFGKTIERSKQIERSHSFWLYVDPIQIAKLHNGNRQNKKPKLDAFSIAMREGVDAIQSIGIVATMRPESKGASLQGYILAARPFERGMRLFNLTAQTSDLKRSNSILSSFVSRGELAIDWSSVLTNFSTVFDSIAGEGEEGVFELVLDDLKNSSDGPKLDLQVGLMDQLQGPLIFGSSKQNPHATVFAVSCKNTKKLVESLVKFYNDDPQATRISDRAYPVWAITPVGDTSKTNQYFVAVYQDHFWYTRTIEAIATASTENSVNTISVESSIRQSNSLKYQLDFESLLEMRYAEIRRGKLTGLLGLATQAEKAVQRSDRRKLPPLEKVKPYFNGQLFITGQNREDGFQISGTIK
jgi:hypothetical protein